MHKLALALLLLFAQHSLAYEITQDHIQINDTGYQIDLIATVNIPQAILFNYISDFKRIKTFNPNIIDSQIVNQTSTNQYRVYTEIEGCLFFFCQQIQHTQDITLTPPNYIIAHTVADNSSYKEGITEWTLSAIDENTSQLQLTSNLQPDFWSPPLLGDYLIQNEILSNFEYTLELLENYYSPPTLNNNDFFDEDDDF